MATLPREPEAFTEQVARLLRKHLGASPVEIVGPLEVTIDDRSIDLDDLYRTARQGEEDASSLIERFVDSLLSARQLEQTPLPFDVVSPKVMPSIRSLDFFRDRRSDQFACQPFVNDTVILYMIDLAAAATPITTEQLIRWGVDAEELDRLARHNLSVYRPNLELQVFHGEQGAAALFNTGDGYDASRLLLDALHPQLAPELGGNFLVAIPTRDVFIAFPPEPNPFVDRLRQRIVVDFKSLPYPITSDLFLVTMDGVAAWQDAA